MALSEKAGMLGRSTEEESANFASNAILTVRLRHNGYAAKVEFKGNDGRTLVALIEDDCYVGWTSR